MRRMKNQSEFSFHYWKGCKQNVGPKMKLLIFLSLAQFVVSSDDVCYENCLEYRPESPLILCTYLPLEFLNCSEPEDLNGNETQREIDGYGCTKWGGKRFEDVQLTKVWCEVLSGVHCHGNRRFLKDGFPCIKYNGHYFVTTLIYSVLLGFLGMDRFCLGHTATAAGKLLTLGGLGIWWIVDIVLLITGTLQPEDGTTAVGKLLTLGGLGIWWIVDIVLLITGTLQPEDGSNWVPYY